MLIETIQFNKYINFFRIFMTLRWSAILLILVDIMNFLFKIKHKKFSFLLFCRFQYVSILKTLFDDELIAYIALLKGTLIFFYSLEMNHDFNFF